MKKSTNFYKNLKISLRNLIAVLLVVIFVIAVVEVYFKHTSYIQIDNSETISNHNNLAVGFNVEKTDFEDLYASALLADGLEAKNEIYNGYPLIKNLSTGNIYDENTVNIVVIGDSFVWGDKSLNRNELFWRLLENDLRMRGYNCRVFGVGMAAANAYEELQWLKDSGLADELDPDIVIFGYVYNDPEEPETGSEYLDNPKIIMPDFSAFEKYIPYLYNRIGNYIVAKTMYFDNGLIDAGYISIDSNSIPILINKGKIFEKYKNDFVVPLDAYAKDADFSIVYMTLPQYPAYALQNALFKPLHTLFSEYTNVAFYDSLDDFCNNFADKKHAANYLVNPGDFHPGSATNRFYADYIIDFLEKDYSDILGKSTGTDLNNYDILINECMPGDLQLEEIDRITLSNSQSVTYSLEYPSEIKIHSTLLSNFNSYYLNYPLGQPYIKLSFAHAVDIESIEIIGEKTENIDLYYTRINEELNYDDHTILPFGTKSTGKSVWTDTTSDRVTSLCIHADCVNNDGSKLTIKITKTEDGGDGK